MCNCRKPKRPGSTAQSASGPHVLILRDGTRKEFGSKLEANAENARLGYTGRVKPVK